MNFNKNDRGHGGKRFEKRSFDKKGFDARGPRNFYKATCAECGDACEVPFKPSGDRPVLCHNCFKRDGDKNFRRPDRQNYQDRAYRRDAGNSEMYEATCDECGNVCEVPFKPNGSKPVFCNDCFKRENSHGGHKNRDAEQLKEQVKILDIKLDRILKILTAQPPQLTEDEPAKKAPAAKKSKKTTKK